MIKDKGNLKQYFEDVIMTIRTRGLVMPFELFNENRLPGGGYKKRIDETILSMEQTSYAELHHV